MWFAEARRSGWREPRAPSPKSESIPAITTWGSNNHSARGQRYRYTRHPDGTEELYDHEADPDEFTNLADQPDLEAIKARLGRWIPKTSARAVTNK